jgi:PAS domain S-box-containing protein
MKILKKPEIIIPIFYVLACLPWLIFRNIYFLPFLQYTGLINISSIAKYRSLVFVLFVAVIIYATVKYFRKKVISSETQYYYLFDSNPLSMGIFDLATLKFVAVNKAAIESYGYSKKEFLSLTINDIREDAALSGSEINKVIPHGLRNSGIWKHKRKDGEVILTEVSSHDVRFKDRNCRLVLARDVTELVKAREEKKMAEESNAQQKNFTTYVLDNFPVEVAIFDKDHRYILINKQAVQNDEIRNWMIGKTDFEYFKMKGMDSSIPEKRRQHFDKALAGEDVAWVDEHTQNGEVKYVLRNMKPFKEDGILKYVYGYGINITEVKKAQLQKDEYIQQLEKIAFTTSHKVRQPICNMQGLINLLDMGTFSPQEMKELIGCMQSSVQILDDYTKELAERLHEYKEKLSIKMPNDLDQPKAPDVVKS